MITGRYPEGLYKLNAGFVRYYVRIFAWVYLQTDEWPPFGISDDPAYPIRVNVAPRGRAARAGSRPSSGSSSRSRC